MKLIWTRSNLPLSVLIRWGLKEPTSHFAIVFDDKIVFHSNLMGVHIEWFPSFKKHYEIVYEINLNLDLELEEKIYQEVINKYDGKGYDYRAFGYFILACLKHRILNEPFPKTNAWESRDSVLCSGLAKSLVPYFPTLFEDIDYDIVSPHQLYLLITENMGAEHG